MARPIKDITLPKLYGYFSQQSVTNYSNDSDDVVMIFETPDNNLVPVTHPSIKTTAYSAEKVGAVKAIEVGPIKKIIASINKKQILEKVGCLSFGAINRFLFQKTKEEISAIFPPRIIQPGRPSGKQNFARNNQRVL